MPRVAVVGSGPGGLAAARRLKERAGESVEVLLFERSGASEYLPGTIPVFLGQAPRARWRQQLRLEGVEVRPDEVEEVSGGGVKMGDGWVEADAVVAAPGLILDPEWVPDAPNLYAFWDPGGAERASDAARRIRGGTVAVVISSLPYRCPPAPYAMAMELAAYYRDEGRNVRVLLTTPEEAPLAAIGGGVPEFLTGSCADAGVELVAGLEPDPVCLETAHLHPPDGAAADFDVAFIVPPHKRSPLLAGLPDGGPLVRVSSRFESAEPGLFVIGDAAMAPLPRAADVAAAGGRTAADAVLERLGLSDGWEPHLPEPECYVGHGGGVFSRISLRYPDGLPPRGKPEVKIEGPSESLAAGFDESFGRWRSLRDG